MMFGSSFSNVNICQLAVTTNAMRKNDIPFRFTFDRVTEINISIYLGSCF